MRCLKQFDPGNSSALPELDFCQHQATRSPLSLQEHTSWYHVIKGLDNQSTRPADHHKDSKAKMASGYEPPPRPKRKNLIKGFYYQSTTKPPRAG